MLGERIEKADVIVVGSGAAGMMAALRARAAGMTVVLIEKARQYGGTTATSGGLFWIPNHGIEGFQDSPGQAMEYLRNLAQGTVPEARLRAYVDNAPLMLRFLQNMGIRCETLRTSIDYYSELPGSHVGRLVAVPEFDGSELGDEFFRMRAPNPMRVLFNRYLIDRPQSYALSGQKPGWQWVAANLVLKYWLDFGMRFKSRRDRRATGGDALIGLLRRELARQDIPLILDCGMKELVREEGRVIGLIVEHKGAQRTIGVSRGVILTAGGFEQNQQLRDVYISVPTDRRWSATPEGGNTGDALRAAMDIGAASAALGTMWWMPVLRLPSSVYPNIEIAHAMGFEQRYPNSIMVNQQGERFCNENISYDRFGLEMIRDCQRTGANVPCWMIFDATYRERYSCGGLMPSLVMPDRRVPPGWWDNYLYRAGSIGELADKIAVPRDTLTATVERFNGFAAQGVDQDFGRGGTAFDQARADRRVKPNGCLGALDAGPYYAVRIDLGDIGSKGGLRCNEHAQVLDSEGQPIAGLYAAGNCAASPFGDTYPGPGGTIGAALTFGFVAAEHLSAEEVAKNGDFPASSILTMTVK
ncbi:MAG TPA: FAD-dependent oxidoreductase [Sphingobium sp.]|uniref:FAD-dependent oxidoreductase n=1 Tax=Sphingobium sp. TaxID=1912891 RepID=UPI002ED44125